MEELSGRDTNAVNKTVSGLLKLLYPSLSDEIPDADIGVGRPALHSESEKGERTAKTYWSS